MTANATPDIDLLDPRSFHGSQPHQWFAWLREHAPVYRHTHPDGPDFWAVTRYDDLKMIGRDTTRFSSTPTVMIDDPSPEQSATFGDHVMMLMADPPLHGRMRRLVQKRFTPAAAREWTASVQTIATKIVDDVIERGECDLVRDLAGAMPSYVIAEMLGIPLADGLELYDLTEALHSSGDTVSDEQRTAAVFQMFEYSQRVYADKMANPDDGLASHIAHSEIEGVPVDSVDFFLWFMLLIDAGGDTTRNLVGAGFHALFEHPDQLALLRDDIDGVMPTAIDELLRWVTPVIYMRRTATVDLELGGQQIAEGDKVVMYYAAANRDPACVDRPGEFDLTRATNPHVSFGGGGAHFCLGANIARIEVEALLREMLTRLHGLTPTAAPTWMDSNFVFGPTSLPVSFTPGARVGPSPGATT